MNYFKNERKADYIMDVSPSPLARRGNLSEPGIMPTKMLTEAPNNMATAETPTEVIVLGSLAWPTIVTVAEQVSRLNGPHAPAPARHAGSNTASQRRMKRALRVRYIPTKHKRTRAVAWWICAILGVTLLGLAAGIMIEGTYQLVHYKNTCVTTQ